MFATISRLIFVGLLLGCLPAALHAQQASIEGRSVVRDRNFTFQKPVESWKERKTRHVVMQQRDYSCGAAALATLIRFYWGHRVNESMVLTVIEGMLTNEQLQERAKEGLTIADVKDAAVKMGYQATVGQVSFAKLAESKVPVIMVVNLGGTNHFVVCRGVFGDCVFLADPIRGNIRISSSYLQKIWIKNAILVVAPEGETTSTRDQMGVEYREFIEGYLNRQVIRRQLTGVSNF
ncbi:C39 family peptidase [Novipirellula artificiosorum]|uniref:Lactococcin-G-processing and transport ATP-binding protein LagD n=1 Tax=Novipirellula artificiosorum TaxID=2528016 RepID=A0A5C6DWR1_9BACT|nr:cysteine peptidase family C39 domain-containing protein [Novipirellula artificiosorum]TWU40644.1 Lactococcin-G-processing and transport ATP-binding protein LagD [Novipirellula artificiosorum]